MLARRVGTDFGWISPPFLVRQRAFGRSAFINGNNGEATNSDDVQRSELFVDLELEFQHVSDFYLLTPQTPMLNRADDELTIFSLLCGAIISLTERNHTKQELINCMNLTLMCIVEEEFSTLDYTELLYDLFIHRNKLVRTLKRELGPEMVSFMNYDIELLVDCLGSSPRESQLRSSHGEITEGDDMSSTGSETSVKGQFVDLSLLRNHDNHGNRSTTIDDALNALESIKITPFFPDEDVISEVKIRCDRLYHRCVKLHQNHSCEFDGESHYVLVDKKCRNGTTYMCKSKSLRNGKSDTYDCQYTHSDQQGMYDGLPVAEQAFLRGIPDMDNRLRMRCKKEKPRERKSSDSGSDNRSASQTRSHIAVETTEVTQGFTTDEQANEQKVVDIPEEPLTFKDYEVYNKNLCPSEVGYNLLDPRRPEHRIAWRCGYLTYKIVSLPEKLVSHAISTHIGLTVSDKMMDYIRHLLANTIKAKDTLLFKSFDKQELLSKTSNDVKDYVIEYLPRVVLQHQVIRKHIDRESDTTVHITRGLLNFVALLLYIMVYFTCTLLTFPLRWTLKTTEGLLELAKDPSSLLKRATSFANPVENLLLILITPSVLYSLVYGTTWLRVGLLLTLLVTLHTDYSMTKLVLSSLLFTRLFLPILLNLMIMLITWLAYFSLKWPLMIILLVSVTSLIKIIQRNDCAREHLSNYMKGGRSLIQGTYTCMRTTMYSSILRPVSLGFTHLINTIGALGTSESLPLYVHQD